MKDLILITAYCPDDNRLNKLRKLVNQLSIFKNEVDVMIVSHTSIPADIQKNVNLCLFDDKNELLTDWDLICQPWFNPNNDRKIQSGLLTGKNTHLAIYRMLILGFSLAKNIGYKKVHVVEYDSEINNIDEFKDNGKVLDVHDSVYYVEENAPDSMFGSTYSFHIDKLPDDLLILDEDNIKNTIRNASSKGPEVITRKIIEKSNSFCQKSASVLYKGGNKFALSNNDDGFNPWGVPFIDLLDNKFKFIAWNQNKSVVNYKIIVNDEIVIKLDNILRDNWKIANLGEMNDVFKIITIEDDVIRDIIKFDNNEEKELFKKISYRVNI